ncbi:MAG: AHH domain-containing protein [Dokdonella sp.]
MAVAWTDTPVFRLIDGLDPDDEAADTSDDACGNSAEIGGNFGGLGGGSFGSGYDASTNGRSPSRSPTPMTGSHIPGVDTGARNGQTTYIDDNGQLQTITSGQGSFGGQPSGLNPIYQQLVGQLASNEAGDRSDGSTDAGDSSTTPSSAEPLDGDPGRYVDYLVAPDADLPGAGPSVDVTLPAFAEDPGDNADAQLGADGQWYTYAHEMQLYAGTQPPGSVPLDTASIDAANAAYEDAVHGFGSPDYDSKVIAADNAINAMIRSNGWDYGPAAPTVLDPVVVNGDSGFNGEGSASNGPSFDSPRFGPAPPGRTSGDGASDASPIDRVNQQISGFNDIVNDELVDEGGQALHDGNDAAFYWNGFKYAFYNTFMPNSVQEGAIGLVGGFAGKALGWLGKLGGRYFGEGIGSLAMAAFSRSGASKALGRALERAGYVRGKGEVAHHLVAWDALLAGPARKILKRFGIDINEAANGVFISRAMHNHLHTRAYYDAVYDELLMANSREEALAILDRIRRRILAGSFP